MRTLYIVKTGSTFPGIERQHGDFEQWIAAGLRAPALQSEAEMPIAVLDAVQAAHDPLQPPPPNSQPYPAPAACAGVVISGSHAMVTDDAPWMQQLQPWLHQICMAGVPVLGICFGHQLLAQTLGGQVGLHPAGLELGTVPVRLQADVSADPLWCDMPARFEAQVVHYQSVRRLPPGACVLAGNAHEPHQAFRWRDHVWGVQFHPEFSSAAMQAYIDHVVQELAQHGASALPAHSQRCTPTPEAAQLLGRFARFARHALDRSMASPWRDAA